MDQNRLYYLLQQFGAGTLSPIERQELEGLLSQANRDELAEHISLLMEQSAASSYTTANNLNTDTFRQIMAADKPVATVPAITRRLNLRWISAAAAVLLVLLASAWLLLKRQEKPVVVSQTKQTKPEKEPGSNKAILTLADNTFVELDSLGNGVVSQQGSSNVRLENGRLAYVPQTNGALDAVVYNKITTPRGGEYTVTLPDGTIVWLNAASSLRFPTAFTGAKREVELTGEAYLVVAEDKQHPFEVKIRDMRVSVLGTQFNIMGYDDEEKTVTTLVTGAVRVTAPNQAVKQLVPGEHSILDNKAGNLSVEKADVSEETAWKNGRTYFNGANIRQIMRQISRWYNVDVQYKGNVANMDFTCTVSRRDKLSKLIGLLEETGAVHFTMEGNTIIVQP